MKKNKKNKKEREKKGKNKEKRKERIEKEYEKNIIVRYAWVVPTSNGHKILYLRRNFRPLQYCLIFMKPLVVGFLGFKNATLCRSKQ